MVAMYAVSLGLAAVIVRETGRLPQVRVDDDPREYILGIPVNDEPAGMFDPLKEKADRMEREEGIETRWRTD